MWAVQNCSILTIHLRKSGHFRKFVNVPKLAQRYIFYNLRLNSFTYDFFHAILKQLKAFSFGFSFRKYPFCLDLFKTVTTEAIYGERYMLKRLNNNSVASSYTI